MLGFDIPNKIALSAWFLNCHYITYAFKEQFGGANVLVENHIVIDLKQRIPVPTCWRKLIIQVKVILRKNICGICCA